MNFWWLGLAHDGEKSYLLVFLAMERASSCEVRGFIFSMYMVYVNELSIFNLRVDVFILTHMHML